MGVVAVVCCAVGAAGCGAGDGEGAGGFAVSDAGIKMTELPGPAFEPPAVLEEVAAGVLGHRIVVLKLSFIRPVDSFDGAMAMADPSGLDGEVVRRWRANGLGVGWVDRESLSLLLANVPAPVNQRRASIVQPLFYQPVVTVERIEGVQRLPYDEGDGVKKEVALLAGQYQFLVRLDAPLEEVGGPTLLDVLPHHFGPRPALIPRTPEQRALDGTSFSSLRLLHPIETGRWLAIWPLDVGPLERAALGGEADAGVEVEAEADGPRVVNGEEVLRRRRAAVLRAAPPKTLGEAMLTGQRGNLSVQTLVLVGVEPIGGEAGGGDGGEGGGDIESAE